MLLAERNPHPNDTFTLDTKTGNRHNRKQLFPLKCPKGICWPVAVCFVGWLNGSRRKWKWCIVQGTSRIFLVFRVFELRRGNLIRTLQGFFADDGFKFFICSDVPQVQCRKTARGHLIKWHSRDMFTVFFFVKISRQSVTVVFYKGWREQSKLILSE